MQKGEKRMGVLTLKAALEHNMIAEFIQQERERGCDPSSSRQLAWALCLSVKPILASNQENLRED